MKNIQSSCRCKHNRHKENDAYRLLKSTRKPVNGITLRIFPRIGISHSMKGFIYAHLKTIFWNGFGTLGLVEPIETCSKLTIVRDYPNFASNIRRI